MGQALSCTSKNKEPEKVDFDAYEKQHRASILEYYKYLAKNTKPEDVKNDPQEYDSIFIMGANDQEMYYNVDRQCKTIKRLIPKTLSASNTA